MKAARGLGDPLAGRLLVQRVGLTVLVLGGTVLCSVLVFLYRGELQRLGQLGYLGAFCLALVGNLVVGVPFPWLIIIAPMGQVYSHVWLTVVAGAGAAVGALVPYVAGARVVGHATSRWPLSRLSSLSWKGKTVAVVALSFSPVFSYPGLAGGVLRYPLLLTSVITLIAEATKVWLAVEATSLGLRLFGG